MAQLSPQGTKWPQPSSMKPQFSTSHGRSGRRKPALLFIQTACGEDRDLQARVEAFLRVNDEQGTFLESPAASIQGAFNATFNEGVGTLIGPYKLIEQIGEGGFGVVFMAEQQHPIRRRVALKVLKAGMDTRQVVARFEAERQALALMEHVGIARVLDGGETPSGRPYFVMELVKGIPITRYCDEHQLTPRERLALFVTFARPCSTRTKKGSSTATSNRPMSWSLPTTASPCPR